jgi:hemoglobin-like flavoprotein
VIESSDELITEFIEKHKEVLVDPEQYPKVFEFQLKMFIYLNQYERQSGQIGKS